LQDKFLALKILSFGQMFKITRQLTQGALNFNHFLTQVRDLAAQFDRISAEKQSASEQFKELLPHDEEFPRFDSWCGGKKREDAPF
jgi:hypothetical protein